MQADRSVLAGVLGTIGAVIEVAFALDEWGPKWVAIGLGAAFLLVAIGLLLLRHVQDLGHAVAYMGSVVLALAFAAAPFAAAGLVAGTLDDWVRVYLAGGAGGLVLELVTSRGQIELPGPAKPGTEEATDPRRPMLPQVDFGVIARFILGGLAAVVVLMIGAAAGADDSEKALAVAAKADLSVAWAIAIGSASAAVWQAIAKMVQARLDAIASVVAGVDATLAKVQQDAEKLTTQVVGSGVSEGAERLLTVDQPAVHRIISEALEFDPNGVVIDTVLPQWVDRINTHVRSVAPAGRSEALVSIGATAGAVEAARAQLRAVAERAGVRLP